jgi:cell division protein FtsI (penicillin-binding protein 3)
MVAIDRRIGYLFAAFLALLALALARAAYLGVIQAGSLQQAAFTEHVSVIPLPAMRGSITDRNGVQLAISEAADDLYADPILIASHKPMLVAQKLAPLLGVPVLQLLSKLTEPGSGYVQIAKQISPALAHKITSLQVAGGPIAGLVWTVPSVRRVYPQSWSLSQVIGGLHADGDGWGGLELEYNKVLAGQAGQRRIITDRKGQTISIDTVRPMVPGKTVALTVDEALQQEVEQVLQGVGTEYAPKGATAIVMNPNTGSILALANWPQINANDPFAAPASAMMDKAVGYSYEPGSTFKAFTVSGAIQDGVVTPSSQIFVPAELHLYDRTIHDAELHGNETLTVSQIVQRSSNIGADEIGMRLGAQRFDYWVHRFGFGSETGVDLPGEQTGIVLHYWQYSGSSMGNLPMGQGESVTPIQMAAAYSAIADGGILRPPHIVQSIGGKPYPVPAGHRIISAQTAWEVRKMLRGVLADGGTASGAAIPGWDLAGKTGTANVVVNGKYSKTQYIASFIGMVPARAPKLVVAVMVDEPSKGTYYGGLVAAPAFQKIVGWAVPHFGINPR